MVEITGSDNIGGPNQTGDNNFGDFGFWFEWIEVPFAPNNLTDAGFDISDGSLAGGTTVYNAGGTDDLDSLVSNPSAYTLGNQTSGDAQNFGVRVTTTPTIDMAGDYRFDILSDDGVRLYVDGVEVVEDDSTHAPRNSNGTVNLSSGQHEIVIIYFERGGGNTLEVDITGPDYPTQIPLQDANVQANAGADTIAGNAGNDTIDGGDDNDTIDGGAGDDTISGGDGNDNITDSSGSNDIDGGAGNDTIFVTGGVETNTVTGGAGDDTITIFNAAASTNTIDGGADNDTIQTGDSTDIIDGGTGDDRIDAGRGNDTLSGGDGDDTLIGFEGDDTQTGGDGFDTFIVGPGADLITDFNTGTGQNINDDDQTNNDFIDLDPFYDNLSELRADLDDDGLLNQSNTTDTKGRTVDYADNTAFGAGNTTQFADTPGGPTNISLADLTFDNTNIICFTPGTLIETVTGPVDVAELRVGDLVMTMDHGPQPLRWIGTKQLSASTLRSEPNLRPIRITKGSLGQGLPETDLVVSPQHRILLRSKIALRMFGESEILVPAKKMTALDGISVCSEGDGVTYIHLAFDRHELVIANGAAAESLLLGSEALRSMSPDGLAEITRLFPDVVAPDFVPVPVRLVPKRGRRIKSLINRHQANAQPVLQIAQHDRHALGDRADYVKKAAQSDVRPSL